MTGEKLKIVQPSSEQCFYCSFAIFLSQRNSFSFCVIFLNGAGCAITYFITEYTGTTYDLISLCII